MLLLVMSVALGVLMLAFVMVMNVVNGVRQHNYEKIFFGPQRSGGHGVLPRPHHRRRVHPAAGGEPLRPRLYHPRPDRAPGAHPLKEPLSSCWRGTRVEGD